MTHKQLVDELCLLAEHVGLTVRRENLDGAAGGLCRLKGRMVLLVDPSLPADQQAEVLASALVEADRAATAEGRAARLEEVYVLPQVRQYIEGFTLPH
ncbi:MAG: hypothetical protein JXL80_00770 [Planctomycetes bacterium]|nr:hypothetical protein [Planctomycetota bacterium]